MKKSFLLISILYFICSCSNNRLNEEDTSREACLDSEIPCPVIMGEKNEACVANIIFLAEGFTEDELEEFMELSEMAKNTILEMEPFASTSDKLNFYRVESPSETSGIKSIQYTSECNGTTGTHTFSDTPWGVFSNKNGLTRFLGMEMSKRMRLEELFGNYATGDYAYTIIIANSKNYYGAAEFPGDPEYKMANEPKVSNMMISKYDSGKIFKYLLRHEFGHSFGNMDDEYVDVASLCALSEQGSFLESPHKLNVRTFNPGSWFEGARYVPTGYWREWENSIMRTAYFSTEFSPVQHEILRNRLKEAIGCK